MSNNQKVELFVENIVTRYSAMREDFVGGHIHQIRWFLNRIRPSKEARDKEFIRILREDVKFQIESLIELHAFEELARASESTLNTARVCVKNHLVRIKFRYDFLMLFITTITIGLAYIANFLEEPKPRIYVLILLVGAVVAIFERLVVLEKISIYEEISNLIEGRISDIRLTEKSKTPSVPLLK
jgi:hypothetical protein